MTQRIALYPGTFDPITYGHIDVIRRAAELFSRVVVLVARNSAKNPLFTDEERAAMIREVFRRHPRVEVDGFNGLLVEYARRRKASVIVRGLRAVSDFEYEFQMALTNRKLAGDIETIFMMPHEDYSYVSSKLIKEAASLGADVGNFIPKKAAAALKAKLSKKRKGK
jgi:pantetheine-phosphate adenylyltransferase